MKYTIDIANTGERYECADDRHLLAGMEKLGRRGIPVGCRNGGCGVCKVRIIDGEYATRVMSRAHVSAQDEADGVVLACRATPRSDLRLLALDKMAACVEKSFRQSQPDIAESRPAMAAAGRHPANPL